VHYRTFSRQDVGVLEPGSGLDLPQEALGPQRGGELGAEHLHGHLSVVPEVIGEVDRSHAALPELTLEYVTVTQGVREQGGRCGQVPPRERATSNLGERGALRQPLK